MLSKLIESKLDIISLAETKLDGSFSKNEFLLEGYKKPYRLDKSK